MPDVFRLCVLPQGDYGIATPDVTRLCVLHKGHAGMPFPTSSDRVCSPRAVMACPADDADHVQSKGDDVIPCLKVRVVQGR